VILEFTGNVETGIRIHESWERLFKFFNTVSNEHSSFI